MLTLAERAVAWRRAVTSSVCDVIEPWQHGIVAKATRHPNYYDFNLVRVEDEPGLSVAELVAFADEALGDYEHRRIDFEVIEAADRRRGEFARLGWRATRLLWMTHELPLPPGLDAPVEEVPYDAVRALREAWHSEDFPDQDPNAYLAEAREVAMLRDTRVLAMLEAGRPVAFAQVERDGGGAEITQVYVEPAHRGAGRGTAVTRAAILACAGVDDLWVVADAEGRPAGQVFGAAKLYARLGFVPAITTMELTRWPPPPTRG